MANEVSGMTSKFFYDDVEQLVQAVDISAAATMAPSTSTGTVAPGKESIALRSKRTIKVAALLYDVFGSELVTGTLVAGKKYLVTASASTFDGKWAVGSIFTSDGTETATASEKVKLHGAEITGGTLGLTIGGTYYCTGLDYVYKMDESDSTTTGTDPSSTESVALRAGITSKLDVLMLRTTAEKITNATPASQAIVITFKTGSTVTGNGIIHQMDIKDDINGLVKVSYQIEWQGIPVEVNCGFLEMGVSNSCSKIYETGTSTNKAITGNAIFMGKTITADVNTETKISYDGYFVGAITPTLYS
jgi:hypothetical protein